MVQKLVRKKVQTMVQKMNWMRELLFFSRFRSSKRPCNTVLSYKHKGKTEPFHLHAIYFVTIASVRYLHVKITIRMSHVCEGALLLIHYYAYNEKRILDGRMEIRVTLSWWKDNPFYFNCKRLNCYSTAETMLCARFRAKGHVVFHCCCSNKNIHFLAEKCNDFGILGHLSTV